MKKTKIVSALTIILSLLVTLSKFDLGVKVNMLIAIMVICIPLIIIYLTEGINDRFVDELANAILLLKNTEILGSSEEEKGMSKNDIKERIYGRSVHKSE